MQEHDNVSLIQQVFAAFGRGDLQTILDHLTPDVEWILEGPQIIPYSGRRAGHDQVQQFFVGLATTQNNQKLTIDDFIAQGDKVVATGRYSAVVTSTGKRIDCAVAHIFTIRDGKIARFLDFLDTAQIADAYAATAAAAR